MDKKSAYSIGLSIFILAVMFYFIGVDQVINALKIANLSLIGLAILIQFATYLLYTLRWKILNNLADINVSFKKLLPIMMVGLAVNNMTPSGRVGGEPVRAYILAEEYNYKLKDTFATVVADKVLDTFPFITLAIITIISMILFFDIEPWIVTVLILAVIAIIAILLILIYMCINPSFGERFENWIINLVRRFTKKGSTNYEKTIHENIFGFQQTMKILISDKKVLYYTIPLSFLMWAFEILRVYIVFLAFGASLNFMIIGGVVIVASLGGMIPLLPGGVGAVEGLMIGLYSKAGISMSLAAPVTLIERLISFWMTSIIGLLLVPHYGFSVLEKISLSAPAEE